MVNINVCLLLALIAFGSAIAKATSGNWAKAPKTRDFNMRYLTFLQDNSISFPILEKDMNV